MRGSLASNRVTGKRTARMRANRKKERAAWASLAILIIVVAGIIFTLFLGK